MFDYGWTKDQQAAIAAIQDWLAGGAKEVFRFHGFAGTGKTYVISNLPKVLGVHTKFLAPSGKAARVLKRKGKLRGVSTIHGFIYWPKEEPKRYPDGHPKEGQIEYDDDGEPISKTEWILKSRDEIEGINAARRANGERTMEEPWSYDLIIVDEVSMVGEKLVRELLEVTQDGAHVPILACGDPFQLPPPSQKYCPVRKRLVQEIAPWAVEGDHDFILTEVKRQKGDSPIIDLSQMIREGVQPVTIGYHAPPGSRYPNAAVHRCYMPISEREIKVAAKAMQVIVETNEQKVAWNTRIRRYKGHEAISIAPVKGDKLVRLRNRRGTEDKQPVMNGEMFEVLEAIYHGDVADHRMEKFKMELQLQKLEEPDDDGNLPEPFTEFISGNEFEWEWHTKPNEHKNSKHRWGYGWAITVHKAQGSQWRNVAVYGREFVLSLAKDQRRWLYTAVTRAEETVVVLIGKH